MSSESEIYRRAYSGGVCEYCSRQLDGDQVLEVVVADSGYLHATDPAKDGRRIARACSAEHADALSQAGRERWVDEQLWAAKLRRVSGAWNRTVFTLDEIAELAGLTSTQLRRAIAWRLGQKRKFPDDRI